MNNVVRGLNTKALLEQEENRITVDATQPLSEEAPYKYVSKMRASYRGIRSDFGKKWLCQFLCLVAVRLEMSYWPHSKGLEAMGGWEIKQTAGFIGGQS